MSDIVIELRQDHERGCGWRKLGGKYLVAEGLEKECGKLPHRLGRCPTCDHAIKASRGWTWVDPSQLFIPGHCKLHTQTESDWCRVCLLREPPMRAGLLWIGETFYPSPQAYITESRKLGLSRRISTIPRGFVVSETIVLLAHRKCEFDFLTEPGPGIFAAFIPRAIEYVVRGDESDEELSRLAKQGCTLVRVERVTS